MPLGQAVCYGFIMTIGGDLLALYPASVLTVKLKPVLRKNGLTENS